MPSPIDVEYLIIGAGPTGLGAAWRLAHSRVHGAPPSWLLVDAAPTAGGLAGSVVDAAGFTWDLGGHVLYSHYAEFDTLLDDLIDDWEEHERAGWVWTH